MSHDGLMRVGRVQFDLFRRFWGGHALVATAPGGHETTGPYKPGAGHRGILGNMLHGNRHARINEHKRTMPPKRKHRVRIRAHVEGRLHGRLLTAFERSWLK